MKRRDFLRCMAGAGLLVFSGGRCGVPHGQIVVNGNASVGDALRLSGLYEIEHFVGKSVSGSVVVSKDGSYYPIMSDQPQYLYVVADGVPIPAGVDNAYVGDGSIIDVYAVAYDPHLAI